MTDNNRISAVSTHDEVLKQYKRLYLACFIVFLITTLVGRVFLQKVRLQHTGAASNTSIIDEAKAMASTFVPSLFEGF